MQPLNPWTTTHASSMMRRRAAVLALLHRGVLDAMPVNPEDVTPVKRRDRQRQYLAPQPVRTTGHE